MAQVTHILTARERIDPYLDYLFRAWQALPEVAKVWAEWEDHDRLDFVVEWPIREDHFHQLEEWVSQGLLTPEQQARYDELLQLIACHRPLLDRLLDEDA